MCPTVSTPMVHVLLLPSASNFIPCMLQFLWFYFLKSGLWRFPLSSHSGGTVSLVSVLLCWSLMSCLCFTSFHTYSRTTVSLFYLFFLHLYFCSSVIDVFDAISRHLVSSQGGFLGLFTFLFLFRSLFYTIVPNILYIPGVRFLSWICAVLILYLLLFLFTSHNLTYIVVCLHI